MKRIQQRKKTENKISNTNKKTNPPTRYINTEIENEYCNTKTNFEQFLRYP